MLISITHPQAFSSDLSLMGFDDAEFVLVYLARKMDSNDRYLPAARALVGRCGATGTTASRLSPVVTARDIGARSSHPEVKARRTAHGRHACHPPLTPPRFVTPAGGAAGKPVGVRAEAARVGAALLGGHLVRGVADVALDGAALVAVLGDPVAVLAGVALGKGAGVGQRGRWAG